MTFKPDSLFQHKSKNGTVFECQRADLRRPIEIIWPADGDKLLEDTAEMIGRHANSILPQLGGSFVGYDRITFKRR